jgi:hypothetical protein
MRCPRGQVNRQRAAMERVPRQGSAPPLVHRINMRVIDFLYSFREIEGYSNVFELSDWGKPKLPSHSKSTFGRFGTFFMRWWTHSESTGNWNRYFVAFWRKLKGILNTCSIYLHTTHAFISLLSANWSESYRNATEISTLSIFIEFKALNWELKWSPIDLTE